MLQRTRKLPRDLKFVLGDRILATTYDGLDTLIEAKYAHAKRALVQRTNLLNTVNAKKEEDEPC